jgi:hypothetical protein
MTALPFIFSGEFGSLFKSAGPVKVGHGATGLARSATAAAFPRFSKRTNLRQESPARILGLLATGPGLLTKHPNEKKLYENKNRESSTEVAFV